MKQDIFFTWPISIPAWLGWRIVYPILNENHLLHPQTRGAKVGRWSLLQRPQVTTHSMIETRLHPTM